MNDVTNEVARSLVDRATTRLDELIGALDVELARHPEARELFVLAAEFGVLKAGFAAYRHFLLNHSRPWDDTGLERAADDPHTVRQWGRLASELAALDALFEEALAGAIAPALARRYAARLGERLHSEAIEVLGASATSGRYGLDRFRRSSAALYLAFPPIETPAGIGVSSAAFA